MKFIINVKDCKELWHPFNKNGIRNYICRIPAKNIVNKFECWRSVNPRCADIVKNKKVTNKIKDTALYKSVNFCSCNGGILMFVQDLVFTPYSNCLVIDLENRNIHGIVDGNHTYSTLNSIKEKLTDDVIITVEFLVGFTEADMQEILDISQGRNTNTSLTEYSLQNSRGCFDVIKEVLKEQPYASNISYKENDREFTENGELLFVKEFDVRDILSRMGVMVSEWCPFNKKLHRITHPYKFYSSKGVETRYMGVEEKYNLIVDKYVHLLPDFIELYDYIYVEIPKWYNKGAKGVKFGKTTRFSSSSNGLKKNTSKKALITGKIPEYKNIMPVIPLIILSALRQLLVLNKDSNKYEWGCDPKVFLDRYGSTIILNLYNAIPNSGHTAKAYSNRSEYVWNSVYEIVKMCYLQYKCDILENLK